MIKPTLVFSLGILAICAAAKPPSRAVVAERLDLLVNVRSFSPKKPLTQAELGMWLSSVDYRLPHAYTRSADAGIRAKIPNADMYTTRNDMKRFVRDYLGVKLTGWLAIGDEVTPDMFGWHYNSGNTMYEPPSVVIRSIKAEGTIRATILFSIRDGGRIDGENKPRPIIAKGNAVLRKEGKSWVVESWNRQLTK